MRVGINSCIIDMVAVMRDKIRKAWDKKKILRMLLIDMKRAFYHVSRLNLGQQIRKISINHKIVDWILSCPLDKK